MGLLRLNQGPELRQTPRLMKNWERETRKLSESEWETDNQKKEQERKETDNQRKQQKRRTLEWIDKEKGSL